MPEPRFSGLSTPAVINSVRSIRFTRKMRHKASPDNHVLKAANTMKRFLLFVFSVALFIVVTPDKAEAYFGFCQACASNPIYGSSFDIKTCGFGRVLKPPSGPTATHSVTPAGPDDVTIILDAQSPAFIQYVTNCLSAGDDPQNVAFARYDGSANIFDTTS